MYTLHAFSNWSMSTVRDNIPCKKAAWIKLRWGSTLKGEFYSWSICCVLSLGWPTDSRLYSLKFQNVKYDIKIIVAEYASQVGYFARSLQLSTELIWLLFRAETWELISYFTRDTQSDIGYNGMQPIWTSSPSPRAEIYKKQQPLPLLADSLKGHRARSISIRPLPEQ